MTTQNEFFQTHAVDGQLTEAQMAEMLTLPAEGDSGSLQVVRAAGEPDPAAVTQADPSAAEGGSKEVKDGATPSATDPKAGEPDPATLNRDNAVILAKDGKHTISFDKLEEARERARAEAEARAAAERRAAELQAQIEAIKAATPSPATGATPAAGAPAPAASAPAPAAAPDVAQLLEGVDFGDYSDESIAKGVASLVAKATAPLLTQLEALKASPAAPAAAPAADPMQAHYSAIYQAHPDADSIAESQEMNAWLAGLPKVAANAYRAALTGGTTDEVIETFSAFKAATGKTGAAPSPSGPDAVAAAEAAIANAKARPPTSLSEIPAGAQAHHNEADVWLNRTSQQALASFEGMTPEAIERTLRKVL